MSHHHHDRCWAYHLLMAGVIHSVPEAVQVMNRHQQAAAIPYNPKQTINDFMGQPKRERKPDKFVPGMIESDDILDLVPVNRSKPNKKKGLFRWKR